MRAAAEEERGNLARGGEISGFTQRVRVDAEGRAGMLMSLLRGMWVRGSGGGGGAGRGGRRGVRFAT